MSGGSWDYVFHRFTEVAERLESARQPERRALGKHLSLIADAMHDIEWVDSADKSPGDELPAIEKVLGPLPPIVLAEVVAEATDCLFRLETAINAAKEAPPCATS